LSPPVRRHGYNRQTGKIFVLAIQRDLRISPSVGRRQSPREYFGFLRGEAAEECGRGKEPFAVYARECFFWALDFESPARQATRFHPGRERDGALRVSLHARDWPCADPDVAPLSGGPAIGGLPRRAG